MCVWHGTHRKLSLDAGLPTPSAEHFIPISTVKFNRESVSVEREDVTEEIRDQNPLPGTQSHPGTSLVSLETEVIKVSQGSNATRKCSRGWR